MRVNKIIAWIEKTIGNPKVFYPFTFIISSLIACVYLKVGRFNFHVPLAFLGDPVLYIQELKSFNETGSFFVDMHLGMPFGSQIYDFPTPKFFFIIGSLLTFFTHDVCSSFNIYYLLGYPVIAVLAAQVFRKVVSPLPALAGGLFFTFLPYHFERGPIMIYHSNYFSVPLIFFVMMSLFSRRQV